MKKITTDILTDVADIAGLKALWAEGLGDSGICIAILDGPVDRSHISIVNAGLTQFETVVPGIADTGPASQHGTHIASVIFGQHEGSVKGVAPRCRGLILPIFSDGPGGSIVPCSQLDLARAISQAVQNGANIINISGGEFSSSGTAHPLLADAVQQCVENDILIVAAAGNQGCDCLHIPGALPSVLAVGAMNSKGFPLEDSNWGEKYQTQGILAPGDNILGAIPGGGTITNSGTSYATPIVSGIAALLLSLQLKQSRQSDSRAVRNAILSSALGCSEQAAPDCRRLLAGRLNVKGATALIKRKGGKTMSDSDVVKENVQSELIGNTDTTTLGSETIETGVQAAAPGGNGMEVSHNPPQTPITSNANDLNGVKASTCGCGDDRQTKLVFVIGQLGYDIGGEARRESIMQHMDEPSNLNDPNQLLTYFEKNPWDAASINWTLNFDTTPIYVIQPQSVFARDAFQQLREYLKEQIEGKIERISISGNILGTATLSTGQVLPVICPSLRCMYSWKTNDLIRDVCGKPPSESAKPQEHKAYVSRCGDVTNFLERIYHELRNVGVSSQQRAINFSATNALNAAEIFKDALNDGMQLDAVEVERSPICRPDSDCWDVKLIFFDPVNQLTQARKVYRFTADVSDVCPVMVGPVRTWFVR